MTIPRQPGSRGRHEASGPKALIRALGFKPFPVLRGRGHPSPPPLALHCHVLGSEGFAAKGAGAAHLGLSAFHGTLPGRAQSGGFGARCMLKQKAGHCGVNAVGEAGAAGLLAYGFPALVDTGLAQASRKSLPL